MPLVVKVIVTVWVPGAKVTLLNTTPTVQVWPGARVCPVQLSVPFKKFHVSRVPPSGTVTALTVALKPPTGVVSVTVLVPEGTPAASVIMSGLGEPTRPATPVPESATGDPVTPVIVSVAITRPVAVGANTTLIVQL